MVDEFFTDDDFQDMMLDANVPMKNLTMADLVTSDNARNYDIFLDLVIENKHLDINFGIRDGMPYYKIALPDDRYATIYLNKEIIHDVLNWIARGVKSRTVNDAFNIHRNANDNYVLHLIKYDRAQGATRYNKATGEYKAVYPHGTINYGKLPYSLEELVAKLDSL
ncbi:MAG: hypothetical protein LUF87_01820 [Alistipes sp.]|nr:hypothetical protein [Alistipes sp.]